jgi:hypothetical protein
MGDLAVTGHLSAEILTDPAELERVRADWDAVAVAAGRPYCAPGWALPWWSAVRPPGAELRVIAVRDSSALVGMAPFYLTRDRLGITTWRLLADVTSSFAEPVAIPGRRAAVAAAVAAALRNADRNVDVVSFRTVPQADGWAALLREQWPGRPPTLTPVRSTRAPYVDIPDGGYDGWLAALSGKSRKNVRAAQREFVRSGGTLRRATTRDEIDAALDDFVRLHLERWQQRGGSDALTPGVVAMLRGAGRLLDPARLQVWTADVAGKAIGRRRRRDALLARRLRRTVGPLLAVAGHRRRDDPARRRGRVPPAVAGAGDQRLEVPAGHRRRDARVRRPASDRPPLPVRAPAPVAVPPLPAGRRPHAARGEAADPGVRGPVAPVCLKGVRRCPPV